MLLAGRGRFERLARSARCAAARRRPGNPTGLADRARSPRRRLRGPPPARGFCACSTAVPERELRASCARCWRGGVNAPLAHGAGALLRRARRAASGSAAHARATRDRSQSSGTSPLPTPPREAPAYPFELARAASGFWSRRTCGRFVRAAVFGHRGRGRRPFAVSARFHETMGADVAVALVRRGGHALWPAARGAHGRLLPAEREARGGTSAGALRRRSLSTFTATFRRATADSRSARPSSPRRSPARETEDSDVPRCSRTSGRSGQVSTPPSTSGACAAAGAPRRRGSACSAGRLHPDRVRFAIRRIPRGTSKKPLRLPNLLAEARKDDLMAADVQAEIEGTRREDGDADSEN